MSLSTLGKIVDDLTKSLGLKVDIKDANAYKIRIKDAAIQIEMDKKQEFVILISDLGRVERGRYREDLFEQALRANGMPPPRFGIFCFSEKSDSLVVFHKISVRNISKDKLLEIIPPFVLLIQQWKAAIENSVIPTIAAQEKGKATMRSLSDVLGIKL